MRTSIHELEAWGESGGWDAEGWDDQSWAEAYDEEDTAESFGLAGLSTTSNAVPGRSSPTLRSPSSAGTVLPAGAGALGTLIGGPVGTAVGQRLGTYAAGARSRTEVGQATRRRGSPCVASPLIPTPISPAPAPGGRRDPCERCCAGFTSQQQAALGALLAQVAGAAQPVPVTGSAPATGSVSSLLASLSQAFGGRQPKQRQTRHSSTTPRRQAGEHLGCSGFGGSRRRLERRRAVRRRMLGVQRRVGRFGFPVRGGDGMSSELAVVEELLVRVLPDPWVSPNASSANSSNGWPHRRRPVGPPCSRTSVRAGRPPSPAALRPTLVLPIRDSARHRADRGCRHRTTSRQPASRRWRIGCSCWPPRSVPATAGVSTSAADCSGKARAGAARSAAGARRPCCPACRTARRPSTTPRRRLTDRAGAAPPLGSGRSTR